MRMHRSLPTVQSQAILSNNPSNNNINNGSNRAPNCNINSNVSNNSVNLGGKSSSDALPKQFVTSMKTLFDILDDQKTGFVRLSDIEKGWQDDGSKGLPHGVIESLRKITPTSGLLTFERFCAGLKICLLRRNQPEISGNNDDLILRHQQNRHVSRENPINEIKSNPLVTGNSVPPSSISSSANLAQPTSATTIRPPSAPLLDIENPIPNNQWSASGAVNTNGGMSTMVATATAVAMNAIPSSTTNTIGGCGNTATVRPNNVLQLQQQHSLITQHQDSSANQHILSQQQQQQQQQQHNFSLPPQLSPSNSEDLDIISDALLNDLYISPPPPPKPPRSAIVAPNNNLVPSNNCVNGNSANNGCSGIDKAEIRQALQNWQMGLLLNEMDLKNKCNSKSTHCNFYPHNPSQLNLPRLIVRGTADGGSNESSSPQSNNLSSSLPSPPVVLHHSPLYQKKTTNVKRREPRRHTLQNGIDYNMLKRLKQFEEEKDVLFQGLTAVERAREWYLNQISAIQEKIKYLGHMGSHIEQWSEAHQEKLDLQRARVQEINRHLSALEDYWERGGFPLHMNLAVRHHNVSQSYVQPTDTINRLKQQNRLLTDEVSQKSEKISILEREKQNLIRDLLQFQRSRELTGISSSANNSSIGDGDVY